MRPRCASSTDPFIKLARVIDPLERKDAEAVEADLANQESSRTTKVARALLAVFGSSVAPDATFSLRISDGEVKRYPMNGTYAPPTPLSMDCTTAITRSASEAPWDLTRRWAERRDSLDAADAARLRRTGGHHRREFGQPGDRAGTAEVVGLIFDGNMEMLPNRFLFTERVARSVWVDSRGIIEALRKVYGAKALADELTGGH